MSAIPFIAEYREGGAGRSPTVSLVNVVSGHRTKVMGFNVRSKKEARTISQAYGAKPSNF